MIAANAIKAPALKAEDRTPEDASVRGGVGEAVGAGVICLAEQAALSPAAAGRLHVDASNGIQVALPPTTFWFNPLQEMGTPPWVWVLEPLSYRLVGSKKLVVRKEASTVAPL